MPLYFGMFISVAAYLLGMWLKKKLGWAVLNPLLVAILLVILFLKLTGISYDNYNTGACYIFLTPATVCLAIPLYKQLELLKKNFIAVILSITAGVAGSVLSVFLMSMLFPASEIDHDSDRHGSIGGGWRYRYTDGRKYYHHGHPWKYYGRCMV